MEWTMKVSTTLLMVFVMAGLGFGEDNPALHQLSYEQVVKTQQMLANFTCPKDAAPTACRSFKELVTSGDSELLTSFMPPATMPTSDPAFTWLVFDDKADNFWVFTAFGGRNKENVFESNLLYVRWFEGQAATARASSTPRIRANAAVHARRCSHGNQRRFLGHI
jgi:hypothetical protein